MIGLALSAFGGMMILRRDRVRQTATALLIIGNKEDGHP